MSTPQHTHAGRTRATVPPLVRTLVGIVLCALALVVAAAPAGAGKQSSIRVEGTYQAYDFGVTDCAPLGTSAHLLRCTTTGLKFAYSGGLAGQTSIDFSQIINCATGRTVGHGRETFTGSVAGRGTGTVTWAIVFSSGIDCATFFPSGLRALGLIVSSSGQLAGLHGVLRFGDVTYEGVLR